MRRLGINKGGTQDNRKQIGKGIEKVKQYVKPAQSTLSNQIRWGDPVFEKSSISRSGVRPHFT